MRRVTSWLIRIGICVVVGVIFIGVDLGEDGTEIAADIVSKGDDIHSVEESAAEVSSEQNFFRSEEEDNPEKKETYKSKKQRPVGGGRPEIGVNWTARCSADVFVVHWTHVPKAGGTAFASLAKKVACLKNPALSATNPCCIPDLCVAEGSCFSTASTCPFVQGIGRHTSNMGRLSASPCCSREWYLSTVTSFLRYALRAAPSDADLHRMGLAYAQSGEKNTFDVVSTKRAGKIKESIADVAGDGKRSQLVLRARSYGTWPIGTRLEFFAQSGVPLSEIKIRLEQKKVLGNLPKQEINRMLHLAHAASPAREALEGILPRRNQASTLRLPKPGEHTPAARTCARAGNVLEVSKPTIINNNKQAAEDACCLRQTSGGYNKKGANSMTMIRNPFVRAVSAYFYRGHNPNYDNYNLRPGLWRQATDRDFMTRRRHIPLREFFYADEYRNILTKMFGDSTECRQVQRCGVGTNEGVCSMITGCHGYRNASDYLNANHKKRAIAALRQHAYFGLLDAYNASVLLAYRTFGIEHDADERDFAKSRASHSLDRKCSPQKVLRHDATACRDFYKAHSLDMLVFEQAHRIFCHRLQRVGLLDEPRIANELRSNRLCDSLNFAKADHACGLLETPEAMLHFKELRARCRGGPRWWLREYGYYWKPDKTPTRKFLPPPAPLPDVPLSTFLSSDTNKAVDEATTLGSSFIFSLLSSGSTSQTPET